MPELSEIDARKKEISTRKEREKREIAEKLANQMKLAEGKNQGSGKAKELEKAGRKGTLTLLREELEKTDRADAMKLLKQYKPSRRGEQAIGNYSLSHPQALKEAREMADKLLPRGDPRKNDLVYAILEQNMMAERGRLGSKVTELGAQKKLTPAARKELDELLMTMASEADREFVQGLIDRRRYGEGWDRHDAKMERDLIERGKQLPSQEAMKPSKKERETSAEKGVPTVKIEEFQSRRVAGYGQERRPSEDQEKRAKDSMTVLERELRKEPKPALEMPPKERTRERQRLQAIQQELRRAFEPTRRETEDLEKKLDKARMTRTATIEEIADIDHAARAQAETRWRDQQVVEDRRPRPDWRQALEPEVPSAADERKALPSRRRTAQVTKGEQPPAKPAEQDRPAGWPHAPRRLDPMFALVRKTERERALEDAGKTTLNGKATLEVARSGNNGRRAKVITLETQRLLVQEQDGRPVGRIFDYSPGAEGSNRRVTWLPGAENGEGGTFLVDMVTRKVYALPGRGGEVGKPIGDWASGRADGSYKTANEILKENQQRREQDFRETTSYDKEGWLKTQKGGVYSILLSRTHKAGGGAPTRNDALEEAVRGDRFVIIRVPKQTDMMEGGWNGYGSKVGQALWGALDHMKGNPKEMLRQVLRDVPQDIAAAAFMRLAELLPALAPIGYLMGAQFARDIGQIVGMAGRSETRDFVDCASRMIAPMFANAAVTAAFLGSIYAVEHYSFKIAQRPAVARTTETTRPEPLEPHPVDLPESKRSLKLDERPPRVREPLEPHPREAVALASPGRDRKVTKFGQGAEALAKPSPGTSSTVRRPELEATQPSPPIEHAPTIRRQRTTGAEVEEGLSADARFETLKSIVGDAKKARNMLTQNYDGDLKWAVKSQEYQRRLNNHLEKNQIIDSKGLRKLERDVDKWYQDNFEFAHPELKAAQEAISKMNCEKPGLKMGREGQPLRQHLHGDPEHARDFAKANGLEDVYNRIQKIEKQQKGVYKERALREIQNADIGLVRTELATRRVTERLENQGKNLEELSKSELEPLVRQEEANIAKRRPESLREELAWRRGKEEAFKMASNLYNEMIVQRSAGEALEHPDTVLFRADYITPDGKPLGKQWNLEYTTKDGQRALITWREDGQIINTLDVKREGTIIGKKNDGSPLKVPSPTHTFQNREFKLRNDQKWLELRGRVDEKARVLSPPKLEINHKQRLMNQPLMGEGSPSLGEFLSEGSRKEMEALLDEVPNSRLQHVQKLRVEEGGKIKYETTPEQFAMYQKEGLTDGQRVVADGYGHSKGIAFSVDPSIPAGRRRSVFHHELGHNVYENLANNPREQFEALWQRHRDSIGRSSKYMATHSSETFAEFHALLIMESSADRFPRRMYAYFRRIQAVRNEHPDLWSSFLKLIKGYDAGG